MFHLAGRRFTGRSLPDLFPGWAIRSKTTLCTCDDCPDHQLLTSGGQVQSQLHQPGGPVVRAIWTPSQLTRVFFGTSVCLRLATLVLMCCLPVFSDSTCCGKPW